MEKWFDVKDQKGIWRLGQLLRQSTDGAKFIGLDGFHPNYDTVNFNENQYYCDHSDKIRPARSETIGLTIPQDHNTLRKALGLAQIEMAQSKVSFYLLQNRLIQLSPDLVRLNIRTQLLVLVDKIMTGPFPLIRQIKMGDIIINKLFINLINFYFKIIDGSKKFMPVVQTHNTAKELYRCVYELTIILSMIMGFHPRSKTFYNHQLNMTLKSQGFLDYMISSENAFPFPLRTLVSSISMIDNPTKANLVVSIEVINFFLDFCEKNKKHDLFKGQFQEKTLIVVQQIIAHLKDFIEKSEQLRIEIKEKHIVVVNRIESCYVRLKPNKQCTLRRAVETDPDEQNTEQIQESMIMLRLSETKNFQKQQQQEKERVEKLEDKVGRMEAMIQLLLKAKEEKEEEKPHQEVPKVMAGIDFTLQNTARRVAGQGPELPKENLGEEMFLGSLEWALETGQIDTAKKLVKWRRSLLQIGRITGWEVALVIGCRTYKKAEIDPEDIIAANYQCIARHSNFPLPEL